MSAIFNCPDYSTPRSRLWATYRNMALWTFQGWITMFFVGAGYAKLTQPFDNLVVLMQWPTMVSEPLVRGLGLVEIVLALAMLVPLFSWRIGRPLVVMAAASLAVMEMVMLVVHAIGLNPALAIVNAVLLAITATVLLGRTCPLTGHLSTGSGPSSI